LLEKPPWKRKESGRSKNDKSGERGRTRNRKADHGEKRKERSTLILKPMGPRSLRGIKKRRRKSDKALKKQDLETWGCLRIDTVTVTNEKRTRNKNLRRSGGSQSKGGEGGIKGKGKGRLFASGFFQEGNDPIETFYETEEESGEEEHIDI